MRLLTLMLLSVLTLRANADACSVAANDPNGRRINLELIHHNAAFIIGETMLPPETQAVIKDMIVGGETAATATARQMFLYKNSRLINERREDVEGLSYLMGGQRPPRFVSIELKDRSFKDAAEEAEKLSAQLDLKRRWISACQPATGTDKVCPPEISVQEAEDLLLLALGPVLFIHVRKPELFNNALVATMNPENFAKAAQDTESESKLAVGGDTALVINRNELQDMTKNYLQICKNELPPPKATATAIAFPVVHKVKRNHRMTSYQRRPFYYQPPRLGRRYLRITPALTRSCYLYNSYGQAYLHTDPTTRNYHYRHRSRNAGKCL